MEPLPAARVPRPPDVAEEGIMVGMLRAIALLVLVMTYWKAW